MLSHLTVIEFASVLAGPDVGMFFAEMGAHVIKIENKKHGGDITRQWKSESEKKASSISAYYSAVNWQKETLFLDVTEASDQETVYELIGKADVIIVNFKPGDAVKLGLDYPRLQGINSTIIYGEINGYGSNSKRTAYDVVLQAETGFMSMNGTETSGPIKMPVALIDVLAAHQLKEGLLLALLKKEKTGKGSFVEVSLYDSALASLKNQASNWLMNKIIPTPRGSLHPNIAPYGETYLTKDHKHIVLAIGSNHHFKMMLEVLGATILLENKKFENNQLRVTHRKELNKYLKPYFQEKITHELMTLFLDQNIPAGTIQNLKEVFKEKSAQDLILSQDIEGFPTKRVKTAIFKISD